jgi:hypothetical protein
MRTLPSFRTRRPARLTPAAALVLLLGCGGVTSVQRAVVSADVVTTLRSHGEATVMISLAEPTGIDATAEPARWQAEIARLQQSVLSQLAPEDFESRTLFTSVPAIAGTLRTERGLAILTAHPNVRRVDLDAGGGGSSAP